MELGVQAIMKVFHLSAILFIWAISHPFTSVSAHAAMLVGIKEQIGENYYELRTQLELSGSGQFMGMNCLFSISDKQEKKEFKDNYIQTLRRLLFDQTLTSSEMTLYELLEASPSDFLITEIKSVIHELLNLMMIETSYTVGMGGFSAELARADNYTEIIPEYKGDFIKALLLRYQVKKIELQQLDYKISQECLDMFVEKLMFLVSTESKILNTKAVKTAETLLDDECIYIGIIQSYARALAADGRFNGTESESNEKILLLYRDHFDKLKDPDLNKVSTMEFLRRISAIKSDQKDFAGVHSINKKVTHHIQADRIRLGEHPKWVRMRYLQLLSKSLKTGNQEHASEIKEEVQQIFKSKGNVFILNNEERPPGLGPEEIQLLEQVLQTQ